MYLLLYLVILPHEAIKDSLKRDKWNKVTIVSIHYEILDAVSAMTVNSKSAVFCDVTPCVLLHCT